ncbi:electron transport complex subunit RsxE [Candidatus Xianfuyuplasma coldseepsis]|uniref:Ion-translocating oxidoreductase complex subunit E n=1 Tax=Candidatus Xianfuyuplasma coldseepsis TaxID=2782163 RepID=A0A7L7KNH7_9MOLU|nr:electron transport complex subunit E [Xianfuyuplasma coldseepsis]QMS84281.1 electron transport complex subunit E [Xianfuyuplasma coldseepsis]
MTKKENFLKGFIQENPIFVFLLGMCPALAVTATFETSLGMGILVIFVLTSSNIVVSLFRNFIPSDVRTPAYIVIIATFVTLVRMLTQSYAFDLYNALGVFIPLIVVNCLILGRAEAFASKNNVVDSAIDGLGMGLGFTMALLVIGISRELIATGTLMYGVYLPFFVESEVVWFNLDWLFFMIPNFNIQDYMLPMFSLAPGAFITLGIILALFQNKKVKDERRKEEEKKRLIEEKKRIALEKKKAAAMKKAGEQA